MTADARELQNLLANSFKREEIAVSVHSKGNHLIFVGKLFFGGNVDRRYFVKTNVFVVEAVCEKILKLAGVSGHKYSANTENASYHPGRCADVTSAKGEKLAILGQVHPLVAAEYGFNAPVFCAELDLEAIEKAINKKIEYTPLPKFPASTRDFSFVCDDELEVGKIEEVMKKAGGKLAESVKLFDIYRGQQIGEGKKSVSMRVTLRAADRTLTVEEADKISKKILSSLEYQLGITLRS